jgi:pilus assembly protein TadC
MPNFDLMDVLTWGQGMTEVNPKALACALVAAAGMFLLLSALGVIGGRGPQIKLSGKISLADEAERINGADASSASLIERLFAPVAQALSERARRTEREWVERAYDLLDKKNGSADYYLRRVVYGMSGFAVGIAVGLALATASESLVGLLIIPAALSFGMYQLPRMELTSDLARRREQMMFEVPYVLDKLTVNIIANNNLIQGMERTVEQARGGYLLREFLQVVEDNAKNAGLQRAFLRMAQRNDDVPMVVRIAMRLAMT